MARQTPSERAQARIDARPDWAQSSHQRVSQTQAGVRTPLQTRENNIRNTLNARDTRKTQELVNDLITLGPDLPPSTLRREEPRGPLPSARGYAERAYQPGGGAAEAGAGIASPITEPAFSAREYYPGGLVSSDGLFVLPAVKKIVMQDANGGPAVFEFAEPGASNEP